MRIHTDHNGVVVNAISKTSEGADVEGNLYNVLHGATRTDIHFQQGPIAESGVNGPTNEALLAILIHRTQFLNGKFTCRENIIAITKMQEALMWLEKRTADRLNRGVEGQHAA